MGVTPDLGCNRRAERRGSSGFHSFRDDDATKPFRAHAGGGHTVRRRLAAAAR